MLKQHHSIKVIAASLLTAASFQAFAGLGSLSVHSALGEPFSGSIVVTGEEAKVLLNQKGSARVGGAPLSVSVRKQGNNAVVYLRSSQKINDPLLSFSLSVGQQGRQYTALLDPAEYRRASPAPRAEKQAAPERDRKAQARTEQRGKKAAAPAKSSSPVSVVFAGEQYTPQSGENLIDIAQKFQPPGLSLRQTVNALVKANPRAFRNGNPDFMYRDVPLVIPSPEQLRQLAQPNADVRRIAQQSAGQQPAAESKPPVTQPAETLPAPQTPPVEAPPAPPVQEAPPATAPSQPADVMPPAASVPELSASAEAPVVASEPAVETVPVAPPQTAPETPQPQPAAEGNFLSDMLGDNWYLYLGGAAALLLLLVGLMLNKRRQGGGDDAATAAPVLPAGSAEDADEDDIVFEAAASQAAPASAAPATAASAAPAATAPAAAQEGDEWDWLADAAQQSQDRLGDTKLTQEAAAATTAVAGATALAGVDLAKPVVPSAHTDEDWMSFEADPTAAATAPVSTPAPAASATGAVEEDEWVWIEDDVADAVPAAASEPVAAVVTTPAETETAGDDLDWFDLPDTAADAPQVREAAVAETTATADADADDSWAWLKDEPAEMVPEEGIAASVAAAEDDGLTWTDEISLDEPEMAPRAQKGTEPTANAIQRQAFATSGQDLAVVDLDWDALDEQPAAEPAAVEARVAEDVFAADSLELEADFLSESATAAPAETAPAPTAQPQAPAAAAAAQPDAGQLKVPMEAKLELAQMYLEIDDAQTARKTLQELIQEADGEVLEKARSLLQQLGD